MLSKVGNAAYKLHIPHSLKIHPVFHVSLLKKYLGAMTEPDAVEVEEEKEFEIEKIVGHTVRHGQLYYLVT